jgi:hypothetical protein
MLQDLWCSNQRAVTILRQDEGGEEARKTLAEPRRSKSCAELAIWREAVTFS